MKKRISSSAAPALLALAAFISFLLFPARYAERVLEGISLWAISVLPVTLPFLFLTLLLSRMPAFARVSRKLSPAFAKCFRVSGAGGCAAVLSVLSGYPAGARAVLDLWERGCLAREERLRAACLATTSGPAFLAGTLGAIAGSAVGWLLFAAHLAGVWSVSFLLGRRAEPPAAVPPPAQAQVQTGSAVTESLSAAVLAAIWLVFGLLEAAFQGPFTLWLPVRLGQLLGGVLIIAFAYGLVEYICRTSFEDRNPTRLQIIAVFVGIATVFLLSYLLKQVLFSLHAGIAVVLIAVLFLIYKITDRMES